MAEQLKAVNVNLPEEEIKEIDNLVKKGKVINRSDFFRKAVTAFLKEWRDRKNE